MWTNGTQFTKVCKVYISLWHFRFNNKKSKNARKTGKQGFCCEIAVGCWFQLKNETLVFNRVLLDLELSSLAEGDSKRCESPPELLFLIEVEWESNSSPVPLLRILGTSPRVPEHFKGLPGKNCELGHSSCFPILTSFACSSELFAKSRPSQALGVKTYWGM